MTIVCEGENLNIYGRNNKNYKYLTEDRNGEKDILQKIGRVRAIIS